MQEYFFATASAARAAAPSEVADVGNQTRCAIGRREEMYGLLESVTRAHIRIHAQTLNPLTRGLLVWSDANFLLRQCCAPLHKPDTQELPVNEFDRSDRKFLAVAVVANAVVLNATDSDWHEHEDLMDKLEVEVEQLCPQHAFKHR